MAFSWEDREAELDDSFEARWAEYSLGEHRPQPRELPEERVVFPTTEWFDEYAKRLNDSNEMAKRGKGWGVDFNGDFILQMDNVPLDKVDQPREKHAYKRKKRVLEKRVVGNTIYAFMELRDGRCTGVGIIEDPTAVEAGFTLTGSYENWKLLAEGQINAAQAIRGGKLELKGDMSRITKYREATKTMSEIASTVPTKFL